MGDIIGGVIGGIGSLIGGATSSSADNQAAKMAQQGYNYLTTGAGAPTITGAQNAANTAFNTETNAQNQEAALLGLGGNTQAAQSAFNNYLGSTGYNFQLDQGTRAIAGSQAARGLLNSGATAKALTAYGQGLGASYFDNYLKQLGATNNQAATTAGQGISAAEGVGRVAADAGNASGNATQSAGMAMSNGIGGLAGKFAGIAPLINW